MIVEVPTKVIPVWYIDKWVKDKAERCSALEAWIQQLKKDFDDYEKSQNA